MKIKIFFIYSILIKLTLEQTINSVFSNILKSDPTNVAILDAYFGSDDYTLLGTNKIIKGTYNSETFTEYDSSITFSANSAVIKINNYYAVACFGENIIGLFSVDSGNLDLISPIEYSIANININKDNIKSKCSITKINNGLVVGLIEENYTTFAFTISSSSIAYNNKNVIFDAGENATIHNDASIHVIGLSSTSSKILCIYSNSQGVLKYDIDFDKSDQGSSIQFLNYPYNKIRVHY